MKLNHIILALALVVVLILVCNQQHAVSKSPAFVRQQTIDSYGDLINIIEQKNSTTPNYSTDILSVNYMSDGKTFYATLWMAYPLYKKFEPSETEIIRYGMLIDADLNNQTGIQGADYLVRVEWNSTSKTWMRIFEELETPSSILSIADRRILDIEYGHEDFFKEGKRYVNLFADLGSISSPDKYRVIFFTNDLRRNEWNVDYTHWVFAPSPELIISIPRNSIGLGPGQQEILEIQLKSTTGFNPQVSLYTTQGVNNGFNLEFEPANLSIPSFGMATSHVKITAPREAVAQEQTLPILASLTVPPRSIVLVGSNNSNNTDLGNFRIIPSSSDINQEIEQQSSVTIRVLSLEEQLTNFVNGIFSSITTIITVLLTIITGISAYFFGRQTMKRTRESNTTQDNKI